MKNKELILKVKAYLETKSGERNLEEGALMVLQLTNNRIMYQNFMRRPKHYASRIEYELQKKYNFYVKELTHEEVAQMSRQVKTIAESNHLNEKSSEGTTHEEFKKGKRADHDSLPEDIQALYAENLSIMQHMRRAHTQLQLLSTENSTCPDSERYPFLQELINLDRQYHANWEKYDHYKVGDTLPEAKKEEAPATDKPAAGTPATPAEEPGAASRQTGGAASAEKGIEESTSAPEKGKKKTAAKPKAATSKAKAKA